MNENVAADQRWIGLERAIRVFGPPPFSTTRETTAPDPVPEDTGDIVLRG